MSRCSFLSVAIITLVLHAVPAPARADTVIAEQLVARVNGRPILLSEIRTRARPRLKQLAGTSSSLLKGIPETQKIYAELLELRIEEEIVASIAAPLHVTIPDADVDAAIVSIAKQNHMAREDLLSVALMHGMTVNELRTEVRRALLRQRVIFTLGIRNKATAGSYPHDEVGQLAWLASVERGAFAAEKRQACIERWVRW